MFSSGLFDLSLHEDLINKADISGGSAIKTGGDKANPRSGSVFKKGKKQEISLNL